MSVGHNLHMVQQSYVRWTSYQVRRTCVLLPLDRRTLVVSVTTMRMPALSTRPRAVYRL